MHGQLARVPAASDEAHSDYIAGLAAPGADVSNRLSSQGYQAAVPGGYIFMGCLLRALAVERIPGIGAGGQHLKTVVLRLHEVSVVVGEFGRFPEGLDNPCVFKVCMG